MVKLLNHKSDIRTDKYRTKYVFDQLDRMTQLTYPDGKIRSYVFDADSNLTQLTDPNGTVVDFSYDILDRMTGKTITRATGVLGTTSESFTYDGLSRLLTATDNDSTVSMIYDALSRVVSTTQNGKTISKTFDGVSNRQELSYPGGKIVSYYHDDLDRISKIRDGAYSPTSTDPIISEYKYIGRGRVKERDYLNGTKLSVTYDAIKRVTDYTNTSGANTLSQYQYAYDLMFNKLFEKRVHQSKRDDYTYDSIYRIVQQAKDADLAGASPVITIGYTLDDAGNRTQVDENSVPTSYTVNNLNQYTDVGGTTRSHDNNGNLLSDGNNTYSYDYTDRLVKIVTATETIDISYDVFGRRIEKAVSGVGSTLYYYEGPRVIEDRDATDTTTATYIYGNGIDEILTMETDGNTYYFHCNSQGSVMQITDSAGAIVERYNYDVYGKPTIYTSAGSDSAWHTADDVTSTTSAIGNRYMYTGREYEEESGLYYYRARFYDSVSGRFLQRDPAGNDDLGNLYAYVNNSPAVYVDPTGKYYEVSNVDSRLLAVLSTYYGLDISVVGTGNGKYRLRIISTNANERIASEYQVRIFKSNVASSNVQDLGEFLNAAVSNEGYTEAAKNTEYVYSGMEVVAEDLNTSRHALAQGASFGIYQAPEEIQERGGFTTAVWLTRGGVAAGTAAGGLAAAGIATTGTVLTGATEVAAATSTAVTATSLTVTTTTFAVGHRLYTIGGHAIQQMVTRGITSPMVRKAIEHGQKFWDPKNKTLNYVLRNGFASGKDLLVGTNPATGKVTTVIRGTNLVIKRFTEVVD